jgi:putrescine aminotransferase
MLAEEFDKTHVLHPWADLSTIKTVDPLIITEAEGVYVYDSNGKRYLDSIGGMWCVNLGYGVKELADVMTDQALQMPYYTPFGAMGNAPSANLAKTIAALTPGTLNRVHFTTGGSTAVDSAIRFVQYYFNALGQPQKKQIISRLDSYHGSTYLSASLSGKQVDRTYFQYEDSFIHFISSPNTYRRSKGVSVETFCDQKVQELEDKIIQLGPENVSCFIAEPILGSGGVIIPPDGYHKRTLAVCRKYKVLYISDEVVTGFGRLGHFFSSEAHFDIIPDIITTAKGLTSGYQPLGALIIDDSLVDELCNKKSIENNYFTNGFTYSGHPIACSVALKNIELMQEKKICEHVQDVGPYFVEKLKTLLDYPIVGDVRGDHLMACVEINVSPGASKATPEDISYAQEIDRFCQEHRLLVRPYENLCIFSPPLVINREEIDQIVNILTLAVQNSTKNYAHRN